MTIQEKLLKVQTKLKAPKGQFNKFGGYKYRSCEDILEAVKPLLEEVKAAVVIGDEIREIGVRIYVQATVAFTDVQDKEASPIYVTAYAREPKEKKGMDEAQITGTASSYARKYALNGLFLIDDAKDSDSEEYRIESEKKAKATPTKKVDTSDLDQFINAGQLETLNMLLKKAEITEEKFCEIYKIAVMPEFPADEYDDAVKKLEAAIKAKKGDK